MANATEDRVLFNSNDSVTGRDGGPYLDIEQAKASEVIRAKVENREPDLDNPGPNAGILLLTPAQQMATESINNLPSQANQSGGTLFLDAAVKDKKHPLEVFEKVPAEVYDTPVDPVEGNRNAKNEDEVDEVPILEHGNSPLDSDAKSDSKTATPTTSSVSKDDKQSSPSSPATVTSPANSPAKPASK